MEHNLTINQVHEALKQGHKVSHRYFTENEYLYMDGRELKTEEGYTIPIDYYKGDNFKDGWGIWEDSKTLKQVKLECN